MYFSSYLLWTWHAETFYAIRLHLLLLFSNYLYFFIWINFIVHFIKYLIKKIKNIMNNRYDFASRLIQIAVFWIVLVFIVHGVVWFGFDSTIHWCFQDIAKVIPIVRVVFAFPVHLMIEKPNNWYEYGSIRLIVEFSTYIQYTVEMILEPLILHVEYHHKCIHPYRDLPKI